MTVDSKTLEDSFYEKVPSLFIEQMNYISSHASYHIDELKNLKRLVKSLVACMPEAYRSKSVRIVDNRQEVFMLCEIPYLDGIIENLSYYLDSEFGEVILCIMGGAYRSSLITLRHMLQLSSWVLQAVMDKSSFTNELSDLGKSMDIEEFEDFLIKNMKNIDEKRSAQLSKEERDKIKVREGISLSDRAYDEISQLTYKDKTGKQGIRQLYADLSQFAHANLFERVNLLEETNQLFPVHNKDEFEGKEHRGRFHGTLRYIFSAMELIICLLLHSAFEDLSSHSVYRANCFLSEFATIVESVDHPKLKQVNLTLETLRKRLGPEDVKNDKERISKYDTGEILCPICDETIFDDEGCSFCDEVSSHHEYSKSRR